MSDAPVMRVGYEALPVGLFVFAILKALRVTKVD